MMLTPLISFFFKPYAIRFANTLMYVIMLTLFITDFIKRTNLKSLAYLRTLTFYILLTLFIMSLITLSNVTTLMQIKKTNAQPSAYYYAALLFKAIAFYKAYEFTTQTLFLQHLIKLPHSSKL